MVEEMFGSELRQRKTERRCFWLASAFTSCKFWLLLLILLVSGVIVGLGISIWGHEVM
jgi:hypothetical protein